MDVIYCTIVIDRAVSVCLCSCSDYLNNYAAHFKADISAPGNSSQFSKRLLHNPVQSRLNLLEKSTVSTSSLCPCIGSILTSKIISSTWRDLNICVVNLNCNIRLKNIYLLLILNFDKSSNSLATSFTIPLTLFSEKAYINKLHAI